MVVNGLDEYISVKCKQCVKTVPICPKPGTRYVIDGCSFVSSIVRQTSWIFGGQWKEIKDLVEKFVISLLGEGCDATFIMPHWEDVLTPTDLKNIKKGLDFVSVNKRLPTAVDFYQNPPCVYFTVAQILRSCRVDVKCSVSDFEFEVAAWAKVLDCTGIISDNNEFAALKGVPYFRLSSLNTKEHTIDYIDRVLLTKNVGLREHHLQLLSCLLGNSLIPPEMLQTFHRKLQSGMQPSGHNPVLDIMPRICMYVRPQTTQYNMLARTALADESKADFLQAIISRYNLENVDGDWKPHQTPDPPHQIYEDAVSRQLRCESIPFICGVLSSCRYEQGVTLEHEPLTTSFNLYRPLRRACYSTILGSAASVTEKCIASSLAVETVNCEEFLVKEKAVTLVRLQGCKRDSLRWASFVKCAKVTFDTTIARQLPSHYLGLCCILNYWWHSPLIHLAQWELNAFLAQAVSQYATDVTSLRRVLVSVVNTRAINLALQLARGAEALLQIASITGLPSDPFLLYNYFDGKLFSFYYYLSDQGSTVEKLCDNLPDRIEMLNFLMMVVQATNLSIDEEEEEEEEEEEKTEEVKKETKKANISIVPEYEAISDDEEDKVEVEPVSDDADELFEDALTGKLETQVNGDTPEKNYGCGITEKPDKEANGSQQQPRLDRKDSTNGTVAEMMKLQMTSPDSENPRSRFPSFPSVTEEPSSAADPLALESSERVAKKLFPIAANNGEPKKVPAGLTHQRSWGPLEPAPPGLEGYSESMDSIDTDNLETRKSRIPLPALPDPLYTEPREEPLSSGVEFPLYPFYPVRTKRHSDKENCVGNQVSGPYAVVGPDNELLPTIQNPVKRHKSEES